MTIQHPSYPHLQIDISSPSYPKYDGSQHCYGLPTEVFFHVGQGADPEDYQEPWLEPPADVHPSVRQARKPYPTYSRQDAYLLRICETCPFIKECFAHAVHNEEFGFWAGTNAGQRSAIRRRLRIKLGSMGFNIFGDKDVNRIRELLSKSKEDADGDE